LKLSHIVPWGRSFEEYQAMFSLSDGDLEKTIVGCGDGPACFNAELTARVGNVVSIDPIYQFDVKAIRSRVNTVYPEIMDQLQKTKEKYIWENFSSIEQLGSTRMQAMESFLADYPKGKLEGRYVNAMLPKLPFANKQFDLALCSHYLFLYSEQVSLDEHVSSILELCRVAEEVRVYPLLSLDGQESEHLQPVMSVLSEKGILVSFKEVAYQFQKGAVEMLVAKTQKI